MGEACKVHVGNLSYSVTEDALFAAFEKCGAVDQAIVVTDRESGRPRGFGFVTFQNEESAKKAITELDGTDLDGRAIKVSESRPRGDGGGRGGGRGYGGGGGGRGYGGGGGGGGGYRGRSDNYSGGGGGYSRGGSGF